MATKEWLLTSAIILSNELILILNGVKLGHDSNPTFLGIRFDPHLTLKHQIAYLKKTCIKRIKIKKKLY